MTDLSGRELLSEWRKMTDSILALAASGGGRTELPRQLLHAMQRQVELVEDVIERERRVQRELAGHLVGPVDSVFDLLEESGVMLRRQAEALHTAGRALEETARLVKIQAELFERTIGVLREPTERVKTVVGLERRPRRGGGRSAGGPSPADEGKRRATRKR